MVAGAGLDAVDIKLCTDENCVNPLSTSLESTSWNKSVKVVLPPSGCGPPCFAQIKDHSGSMITVVVNRPDVWWVTTSSPGRPAPPARFKNPIGQLRVTVQIGDAVRVFGRALGWISNAANVSCSTQQCDATQLVCASGKVAPTSTQTRLKLIGTTETGTTSVLASSGGRDPAARW